MLKHVMIHTKNQLLKVWVRASVSILLLAILWIIQPIAYSAEMKNIYQGKAEVSNQSQEQRNKAIKQALQNVLSKLLSQQAMSNSEAIESILAESSQYAQQYSFETSPSEQTGKKNLSRQVLVVSFDPFALNAALESNGFKAWGTDRPEILVWLAYEKNRIRRIFTQDTMPEVAAALDEAAEKKGLPILFPLMDLTDRQQLTVHDIWIGFDDRVRQASVRYGVDNVLAGRLVRKTTKDWKIEWKFFQRNEVEQWQETSASLSGALQTGIDRVFEQLIHDYAPSDSDVGSSGIRIRISGTTNRNDVNRVIEHLQSLSAVRSVEWLTLEPGSVMFRLILIGNEKQLEQLLTTEEVLEPVIAEKLSDALHYRLLP